MLPNILLNANPETLRWIEFNAGTSNNIILSPAEAVLAKAMLQEAERHSLAKGESLATGSHVERLKVALALHKAVPTEVLRIIFQYTKGLPYFPVNYERARYGPLKLSHVCSRWRAICRSQPSFWNDASFVLGNRKRDKDILFWIENFIVDSYPLSLEVIAGLEFRPFSTGWFLLLSQNKVIRRLDIDKADHFLGMPKHSFPLLEDLSIIVTRNDPKRSRCFVGMVNLRIFKVGLAMPTKSFSLLARKVPWRQLTNLCIWFSEMRDFLSIPQAVKLLEQCKSLQKCTIFVKNVSTPCPWTTRLPYLTDLVLVSCRSDPNNMYSLTHCLEPLTVVRPDVGHLTNNSGHSIRKLIFEGYRRSKHQPLFSPMKCHHSKYRVSRTCHQTRRKESIIFAPPDPLHNCRGVRKRWTKPLEAVVHEETLGTYHGMRVKIDFVLHGYE